MSKPKYRRRLRAETVRINGCIVMFYRCPKKRRWEWCAFNGKVKLPKLNGPDKST